jgi:hypothetical protein
MCKKKEVYPQANLGEQLHICTFARLFCQTEMQDGR